MNFVQMFQFTTSDVEGIRRVDEEWRKATEGKRTVRREVIAADRNQPGRYFAIVFFDSYESAMENSTCPRRRPPPRSTWSFPTGSRSSTTWTSSRTGPDRPEQLRRSLRHRAVLPLRARLRSARLTVGYRWPGPPAPGRRRHAAKWRV